MAKQIKRPDALRPAAEIADMITAVEKLLAAIRDRTEMMELLDKDLKPYMEVYPDDSSTKRLIKYSHMLMQQQVVAVKANMLELTDIIARELPMISKEL